MTLEERNRIAARQRMRDKYARGECRSCPGPTEPGKSRCAECRKRHQASQRRWRARGGECSESRITPTDRRLSALGRCRCGLLLPCHSCIPTITELATSRRGEVNGLGPAPGSHSGNAKSGSRMP